MEDINRPDAIDTICDAARSLRVRSLNLEAKLARWAELHGWDLLARETAELLARQAVLDAAIRQTVPGLEDLRFPTPLDELEIDIPPAVGDALAAAIRARGDEFNYWGNLYSRLIPQEKRRHLGQFWTSELVAEWMVAWLLAARPAKLVDVGCGSGSFLLKAHELSHKRGLSTRLQGLDISPLMLNIALANLLSTGRAGKTGLPELQASDFLVSGLPPGIEAVVCNPPYTRHHSIPSDVKDRLQAWLRNDHGMHVSRLATLASYFLLRIVADMEDGARAAVIVPMEAIDALYGLAAKRLMLRCTALNAIIHFSPEMSAFQKVDVGACILMFTKGFQSRNPVRLLRLTSLPTTAELLSCIQCEADKELPFGYLAVQEQEALSDTLKWLAVSKPYHRPHTCGRSGLAVRLGSIASVVRGIATGANDFFLLPTAAVQRLSLQQHVVRTLHRNREAQGIALDEGLWQSLAEAGKRVWLLYLDGRSRIEDFPALRSYIGYGESKGYHLRSLVQTRKKWYLMEQREVPPIIFTLLTRGNPRFILNTAGVRPTNMFLLIYPARDLAEAGLTQVLWALLNSDFCISGLHAVSRTYGGNTLKVEPRELDNLPVINPLALPRTDRDELQRCVARYLHGGDQATFKAQVNEIVLEFVSHGQPANWSKAVGAAKSTLWD